jgi:inorganic pyrophosphatase
MIRAVPADRPSRRYLRVIASATSGTENTRSPVTSTPQSIVSACIPFPFHLLSISVMSKKQKRSLADPTSLNPRTEDTFQVIIETPKASRNKYSYDPEQGIFTLRKVLPEGMVFPYDFGFLPRTLASDGDPIDVLLLMDVPAFPGCLVPSRLIGVMEGEQLDGKKKIRNDRLIAVAELSHAYKDWKKLKDLPDHFMTELEAFFVNYHGLEGKKYKLLGCKEAKTALDLVKKSQKAAARVK